jgi:hypothetical protein
MRGVIIMCIFFLACSTKKKQISFEKMQKIDSLINQNQSSKANEIGYEFRDTTFKENNRKDSIFYKIYGDSSSYGINYIDKLEYSDTVKVIKFYFNQDLLILIDYQGQVPTTPEAHWNASYYIEENKVIYQLRINSI